MNYWLELCAVAFVWIVHAGRSCPLMATFNDYMKCVDGTVSNDYGAFETEIREHNRLAIKSCFAQTIPEGNEKNRCVLAISDLNNKAWDRNGPLRNCSICRTFANGAIKAIMSTSFTEQKCIRTEISKAITSEAVYCLRNKMSDFTGILEFPDFEEGSYKFREAVIDSISDHILIYSRLAFCNDRKPTRADATRRCMKKPFDGYLTKHCNVLKACEGKISKECQAQTIQLRKATCECVETTRADLKKRLASIAQAIRDVVDGNDRGAAAIGDGNKVDQCVSNIKNLVKTPVNDWFEVVDDALKKCLEKKPTEQNLGLDSLINIGCRKVIADTTGTAHIQLKAGFDFINNLMDAMVDRSGRFCGGLYCE